MMRLHIGLLIFFFGIDVEPAPSFAQGTVTDASEGTQSRKPFAELVFRDRVRPQWIDENRFWYRIDIGPQQHEFVLVDAAEGKRGPLFDHQKLAASLRENVKQELDAKSLPLTRLIVDPGLQQLEFTAGRRRWRCPLDSYVLQEIQPTATADEGLRPLRDIPRLSRRTGAETTITFLNRSSDSVRLFWRSPDGRRVAYGTIEAGEEHPQHTYAGHVWEVTNIHERPLVGFIAADQPERAVIAEDLQPVKPAPRRQRRNRDSHRSPDRRWTVLLEEHNIILQADGAQADDPERFTLTEDGSEDDAYAGRVYWSPDSKWFVVMQTRSPQEHPVHLIESAPDDQLQPKLQTFNYLKPGDRIAHPRPRLFDVARRKAIPISDELFPNPWSIRDVQWDEDSHRFTFLYNQRGHQLLRVIAVDTEGNASVLIDETAATFIDYNSKLFLRRLPATDEILWMSERDGWNHLWLYDAETGQVKQQVTQGPWVVRRVEHIDEQRRQIWFMAGGVRPEQDPYYPHLCRVDFDGSNFTVLTEGDGTHAVEFSPDRTWFIDSWSRVDQPAVTELRRARDGKRMCCLERADHQALLEAGWTTPERFVAPGRDGETDIYGIIIYPSRFDPARRYPVVEQIYAGPHGAHVPKDFSELRRQHALADEGFILVQIDGMGTNWRSKRFHDVCWKNLADAGFPDRIAWMKAAAADRPSMDLDRVGIYGGSAGGQNAMRALLDHHSFYKVAVADCGCHDNRMDKIWWNELWMGYPVGPQYAASSNTVDAHKLKGKLMLIVGELDRNVDPASTMQVVAALQKADKDFDLVVIAGQGHGAAETPYGSRRRLEFLKEHLLAE